MTTPIVRGSSGRAQPLLGLHQAVGGKPAAQPLEREQQVALAGDPQLDTANVNDGDDDELPG